MFLGIKTYIGIYGLLVKVFPNELEVSFQQFTDVVKTFPLFREKGKLTIESSCPVGFFKV